MSVSRGRIGSSRGFALLPFGWYLDRELPIGVAVGMAIRAAAVFGRRRGW